MNGGLNLKCDSCDAEMVQSFKKNEQGRNICAWTCPCGVAKPKSDALNFFDNIIARYDRSYGPRCKLMVKLDYSKIEDIEVDGFDFRDAPDFCDAYISYATYEGRELSDSELESLDPSFVYECIINKIY